MIALVSFKELEVMVESRTLLIYLQGKVYEMSELHWNEKRQAYIVLVAKPWA